jgi:hypothetical protein
VARPRPEVLLHATAACFGAAPRSRSTACT